MEIGKTKRAAIVGGDRRAPEAGRALTERGFLCTCYALDSCCDCDYPDERICREPYTLKEALENVDAVLLPLPLTRDGQTLNAPFSAHKTPLAALRDALPAECLLVGGGLPDSFCRGRRVVDLLKSREFAQKNALPSAEGAIGLALLHDPGVLENARCAITGYGAFGEVLARKLRLLGAQTTVFARREEVRRRAEAEGHAALPLDAFTDLSNAFDLIFNTVPANIYTDEGIRRLRAGALYLELASAPGGMTARQRASAPCACLDAPGLPGRYSPRYSGELIAGILSAALDGPAG